MTTAPIVEVPVEQLSGKDLGTVLQVPLPRGITIKGTLTGVEHSLSLTGQPQVTLRLREGHTTRCVVVDVDASATNIEQTLAARVLALCDTRRIFTADVAGGYRGEGWRMATDAFRELVTETGQETT